MNAGKSFIVLIFVLFWQNKNLKTQTYDKLKNQPKGALIFRSIQTATVSMLKIFLTEYFSLIILAIANNSVPMITVFLAYFILGEKLSYFEILILVLILPPIVVIIY